jgi:hypothetical protein
MILDLTVDGQRGDYHPPWREAVEVGATVHGTDALSFVELVEIDLDQRSHAVVRREECRLRDHAFRWVVEKPPRRTAYYLRVRERADYRGRAVMGWSSPVWIGQSPAS